MLELSALIDTVQKNCTIAYARHARDMTMCTFLLEMREYYRWEMEIPYGARLPKALHEVYLGFGPSPAGLLAILVIFVLARIFRHGAEMRADLEGTV